MGGHCPLRDGGWQKMRTLKLQMGKVSGLRTGCTFSRAPGVSKLRIQAQLLLVVLARLLARRGNRVVVGDAANIGS
jgi:hypothetical protein